MDSFFTPFSLSPSVFAFLSFSPFSTYSKCSPVWVLPVAYNACPDGKLCVFVFCNSDRCIRSNRRRSFMGVDRLILKFRLQLLSWLYRSRSGPIAFVKQYSYKDLKKATNGFNRVIYSNSQVVAYKAKFQSGRDALVKEVKEFHDSNEAFFREAQLLGRLNHRHILALRGFSIGRKRFLVSDNVENGSLKEYLNDPLRTPLNWTTRLQIAIGVAAALEYLYIFSDPPVYHVSISTSSIMLDDKFTVKLSDVGLLSSGRKHESVRNPQFSEDNFEEECQNVVFQLGLLILELITGQSSEKGCVDLVKWIQGSRVASSMQKMIDPDLGNSYDSRELQILLAVAKLCIQSKKKTKLSISQVIRYLHRKVDTPHN